MLRKVNGFIQQQQQKMFIEIDRRLQYYTADSGKVKKIAGLCDVERYITYSHISILHKSINECRFMNLSYFSIHLQEVQVYGIGV